MSIPSQTEMYQVVLSAMDDGIARSRQEIVAVVRKRLNLTADDVLEKTSSKTPVYKSRVNWSVSYLNRASYLARVSRGTYVITSQGQAMLKEHLNPKDFMHVMLAKIDREILWNNTQNADDLNEISVDESSIYIEQSPQERIDAQVNELNESLADELLNRILDNTPEFFEQLVVDLVERMGYGKGRKTQLSGDYGIDGIISTDELGFSPIYTQAKRFAPNNPVGAPMVQAFAGAMNWVTNGIFITTSSFTKEAMVFAESFKHATIKLIDGKQLVNLMIKHKLGVTVDRTVEIMKIDLDYFES